ncbi:MAG: ABC transporter substrate-binding protein [Thermomicrobiales bacterium]
MSRLVILARSILFLGLLLGPGQLWPEARTHAQEESPLPAARTQYPLTIENCGQTLTFERPPQRILATYQNVAEILVALGLTESIVGVTYGQTYPAPAGYEEEVNGLNWMVDESEPQAAREVVLSARPDFVLVAYPAYDLDANAGYASEADYASIGAQLFRITDQCLSDASSSTIETVYADILALGQIFDVQERAEDLVATMRDQIAETQVAVADRPPVEVIFSGGATEEQLTGPVDVYGAGLNADMIRLAGGHNLFGDGAESYLSVNAEEFARQQADIFALIDTDPPFYGPVSERANLLFTTFPEIPASRDKRFVAVDGAAYAAGIRIPEAIDVMARSFHPEAFPESNATPAATAEG